MKRWVKWVIALLVVLALVLVGGRALKARKEAGAVAAAAASAASARSRSNSAVPTYSLPASSRDAHATISGGLKAVTSAVVKAKVASELKSLTVREGDSVKAGQVVGQFDTTEFEWRLKQAEQTAVSARTQLDIAKRAARQQPRARRPGLHLADRTRDRDLDRSRRGSELPGSIAATEIARKSRADAVLIAPISGIVSQRVAQPGERVAIDAKVIEVVDLSRIELEAAVAPEDVGGVQVGQSRAEHRRPERARDREGRAHQSEHPGRHARSDGLPRAAAPARAAPGPVRARHDRAATQEGDRSAGVGGARRPGPAVCARRRRRQGRPAPGRTRCARRGADRWPRRGRRRARQRCSRRHDAAARHRRCGARRHAGQARGCSSAAAPASDASASR